MQQNLFSPETYKGRRSTFAKELDKGVLLILANEESPMNYTANTFRYRQDSNFLYYFGLSMTGIAGVIDMDKGKSILFGDDPSMEDIVWTGPQTPLATLADRIGVDEVKSMKDMEAFLEGREVHYTPPYRMENIYRLSLLLKKSIEEIKAGSSELAVRAIIKQREVKSDEEIAQMEKAIAITAAMHTKVMATGRPGMTEAALAGIAEGIAVANGGNLAYAVILSKDGQTLHNHGHFNTLKEGDLVLGDFGAENEMFYAGDITRTFPVGQKFTDQQKAIYRIVLDAEEDSIKSLKPGVKYQDVHIEASRIIARGLKHLGIMKGDPAEAVEKGAHALFFPHGLGHMIGLDVHDMEDLGEDLVGYDEETKRSDQFGLSYLRLGKALQPGFVLTVEPGIYFIPELIDQWEAENRHTDFINFEELKNWRSFGGIRIEDNILITPEGSRILGPAIPKGIDEVESLKKG